MGSGESGSNAAFSPPASPLRRGLDRRGLSGAIGSVAVPPPQQPPPLQHKRTSTMIDMLLGVKMVGLGSMVIKGSQLGGESGSGGAAAGIGGGGVRKSRIMEAGASVMRSARTPGGIGGLARGDMPAPPGTQLRSVPSQQSLPQSPRLPLGRGGPATSPSHTAQTANYQQQQASSGSSPRPLSAHSKSGPARFRHGRHGSTDFQDRPFAAGSAKPPGTHSSPAAVYLDEALSFVRVSVEGRMLHCNLLATSCKAAVRLIFKACIE
jgi:hypothetical protein